MNRLLDRPSEFRSDSTMRRIRKEAKRLVRSLLMLDEYALTSPVVGVSDFAERYPKLGPFDSVGRSLRELDLQTRLFKYRCSPMIYADAIEQLPPAAYAEFRSEIGGQLAAESETSGLPRADRLAVRDILFETYPQLFDMP